MDGEFGGGNSRDGGGGGGVEPTRRTRDCLEKRKQRKDEKSDCADSVVYIYNDEREDPILY